jgi:transcriptional regulator with XRE-family HTH domain
METKMIGNKIAEARKKINISQSQLAKRLFISAQAVGKWERGESMPDIITFNRLAEILEVDLNYFSENFFSTHAEMEFKETSVLQYDNIQTGEQRTKRGWDMSRGNWIDADFSGLKNLHDKFSSSNMKNCKFINSDLSGLLLQRNHVSGCDFSSSDMSDSQVQNSHFASNLFKSCSLNETEFSASYLNGCDFSDADFTRVTFKSGGFVKNKIANAVWNGSSFINAYLADIVFDGTLDDCSFENCAFKKVKFKNATLINTFFKNRTLKGIRFIDCQADRLTYEFLKNGKADLTGIRLLTS